MVDQALTEKVTQRDFARAVGLSDGAVSQMITSGLLRRDDTFGAWLIAYTGHLRGVAAGRSSNGAVDLASERARLAKEQADRIAMENAQTRRELAPVSLLEVALGSMCTHVGKAVDAGIAEATRSLGLDPGQVDRLRDIFAKARNAAASADLDLAFLEMDDDGDSSSD